MAGVAAGIPLNEMLGGAVAGVAATALTMPADVIRSQTLVDVSGGSFRERVRRMVSSGSALKGLRMRMAVNVTFAAVYFCVLRANEDAWARLAGSSACSCVNE